MSNEEKHTQDPAIEVLQKLGWKKIKDNREKISEVLQKDILFDALNRINSYTIKGKEYKFEEKNINNAIRDLSGNLDSGLINENKRIFELLFGGRTFKGKDRLSKSFKYIDFKNIENNTFSLIKEYTVKGNEHNIRPDIVLFINGIPLISIECKAPDVDIKEAISQSIRNQNKEHCPLFFIYNQLTIATNKNEFKYGTCKTPEKFYSLWKEQDEEWLEDKVSSCVVGRATTLQDKNLISLLDKERFFDIFKNFIVFKNDIKIIPRYQQYFAVKKMLERIETRNDKGKRNGGVIWHTQGSGKSLTMVMLAKAITGSEGINSAKIVVVTDRVSLDQQITTKFKATDLEPHQAANGRDLIKAVNRNKEIVTTTVHKFEKAYKEGLVDESKDVFVLIDESHRTEYGKLNSYMNRVFPNGCYIGFTGTPLMKKEKNTMHKFGSIIHKYTIQDAVSDKAILPLIYEGKMVDQSINEKGIDKRIEQLTRNLNERQAADLKRKWSRYSKMASSDTRMEFIAYDIHEHFNKEFRGNDSRFKAMFATTSKADAITYYKKFEKINNTIASEDEKLNIEVVVSPADMREGYSEVDERSNDIVIDHWEKMLEKYGSSDKYDDLVKSEFKDGDIDLIIVVDKLLTGFDAPKAIVLYIDKPLKEHSLLQAIARVNRLHDGKEYGYIIDYRGLLKQLDEAMDMYSGAGLENFDPKDIKGALISPKKVAKDLINCYSNLEDLFITIKNKDDLEEYEQFLEPRERRDKFYEKLSIFGRNLKIVLDRLEASEELEKETLEKYKRKIKFYQNLRAAVKRRYSDDIDFSQYEPQMKNLLDTYVNANDVEEIVEPVDIMNIDGFDKELKKTKNKKAKADMIKTRMAKSLQSIRHKDPARFEKFSDLLKRSYEEYKKKREEEGHQLAIVDYLKSLNTLKDDYTSGRKEKDYPDKIKGNRNAQVIYDMLEDHIKSLSKDLKPEQEYELNNKLEDISLELEEIIDETSVKPEWHKSEDECNELKTKLLLKIRDYVKGFEFNEYVNVSNSFVKMAVERYKND